MAQRHAAAVDVQPRGVEVQKLCIGHRDNGEGLVDLVILHRGHPGQLQRPSHGAARRDRELRGLHAVVCKGHDSCGGGHDAHGAGALGAHQDHGGSTIVQRGRRGGGDGAPVLEDGRECRDLIDAQAGVLLVDTHGDDAPLRRRPLAARGGNTPHAHGGHLQVHGATLPGIGGAAVGRDRVPVLVLPRQAQLPRHVLRAGAQVPLLLRIREAVEERRVLQHAVAVAVAARSRLPQHVRRLGHALHATRHHDISKAQSDHLGAHRNSF
mmetsp:Transcript_54158/g.137352  ORF Transcript_54158/g.137352 Transcript_54158/m.137352 type:complete len:267 (-) Transcript_54158:148-948(-)